MKKIILIGTILLSFSSLLNSQWIRIYGTSSDDQPYLVLETSDGGCMVAGISHSIDPHSYSLSVIKLDSSPTVEWQKTYVTDCDIHLHFLRQTDDGGYIISGIEFYYGYKIFLSLKLDPWGNIEREYSWGSWAGRDVHCAGQTRDGGYVYTGYRSYSYQGENVYEFPFIRLAQSGEAEWQRAFRMDALKKISSLHQTADGGFVLSGIVSYSDYGEDIIVLKLSSGGDLEWQAAYGSGTNNDEAASSIQQTSDGGYILTGYTQWKYPEDVLGDRDILVLKLSSTGDFEWSHTFGGNDDDYACSVQQTSDGGYIVSGTTYSFGAGGRDIWILKLSSSGEMDWQRTYGAHSLDMIESIQQTSDDGYLIAGSTCSFGAGSIDCLIMKLLPDGQISLPCGFISESTAASPAVSLIRSQIGIFSFEEIDIVSESSVPYFTLQPAAIMEYELCSQQPLLAISCSEGGTTNPAPGTYVNDSGVEIEITAVAESGYRFGEWTGDATGTENPLTVIMDSDKSLMANFFRQFSLTILAGEGGTTDPEPGIYVEDYGTEVSITALPESRYQFSEWSGPVKGTSNPITITMNTNTSVTANFVPVEDDDKNVLDKIFRITTCAIATAAYDSPSHPHVKILREFRDKFLMRTEFGPSLVKIYYKYSPFGARYIAKHRVLKIIIRFYLLPVVAFSYSMVHFGPLLTAIISLMILAVPVFFASITQKRNKRAEARP